jgi:serine phosphatase RsbU (regulator of sigma subunit)
MLQSLRYAKLIQDAILPSRNEIEEDLKEMFVLFKPFEIVSGDFYWYHKVANKIIVAAIDCTGHGVPGAFMSMMGNVLLSKIVQQDGILSPSLILEELHKGVQRALHQQKTHNTDGMDMSIVVIDKSAAEMTYAGAMNPLVYFQGGAMQYIRGTRRGIGGIGSGIEKPFLEHKIPLLEETTFYLFSDGYQDQFGTNGKKFMSKKFKNLLAEIHELPLRDQKEELQKCHDEWRDGERVEQTDDVLIIGCRV